MEVGENGSNGRTVLHPVTEEINREVEYATVQNRRLEEQTVLMMVQAHRRLNAAMRITVQVITLSTMYIVLSIVMMIIETVKPTNLHILRFRQFCQLWGS